MKRISKPYFLAATALMAIALAIPFALAQPANTQTGQQQERKGERTFGKRHRGHGRGMGGMMLNRLNLTDAQKAQLEQLRQSHRERTQPLRQELRAKMQELRQAQQGGTFNEALVAQKLTETAPLRAKLMGEHFKMRQEMLALLTPEQKTQLEQMREQFKTKREHRRGHRSTGQSSQVQ
jgi:Spy/CpxP family protein refolding chaperone